MKSSFKEFVNKKIRESRKQLRIIGQILEKEGFPVKSFLEDHDPYIFIKNPGKRMSFDGIRLYKIGSDMAFRVQKQEATHPYGRAYPLDVEGMFNDLMSDMKEEPAGHAVMKGIVFEVRNFFEKSLIAERELRASEFDQQKDPMDRSVLKTTGTDYSNQVFNSKSG